MYWSKSLQHDDKEAFSVTPVREGRMEGERGGKREGGRALIGE